MFAVLLVSLVAACAAAPSPRFGHHHHHGEHAPFSSGPSFQPAQLDPGFAPPQRNYDPFGDDVFDTRQFWAEMANELRQLDEMLAQFSANFPSVTSSQGVDGKQYKITIPLAGFDEKDIVVKAREGLLMVQAVHKLEGDATGERSYLDIKTLPSRVNVTGSWTYEDNVLKIVFPLKPEAETGEVFGTDVTEAPVTEAHSREEMSPTGSAEGDVDVGTHDIDLNRELFTNEIPRNSVEATTYAVDLKDEVEFVPVRYR